MNSSSASGCKIGGIIGLSFCFPMIFVLVLFQFLGIGEYVYPIVIPIFLGIGATFLFVSGIIMFAVRSATRRTMQFDQAVSRSYEIGMISDDDFMDADSTDQYLPGAQYKIPVYCPFCQRKIELYRVEWSGTSSLVCPSCSSHVRVKISEE
ncbi:MAG: hypothetical protein ACFFER_18370 [Candidatus Thorarchaeota archaeon]